MSKDNEKQLGMHKLATETIAIPPEREAIAMIQATRKYRGWEPVEEAQQLGLLRSKVRHAEVSPTFRCTEDCGGCPDRASMHLNDGPEAVITDEEWLAVTDRLVEYGVEYILIIGGTVDRNTATPKLMSHILDKEAPVDVGWFTDGIMLQNPYTGRPTVLFDRLLKQGRMKELTTHVSADYLVPEGVVPKGPILDPHIRWENEYGGSRYYKSAYGERLAQKLVELQAKRVILNTAISAHNIGEVINVYKFVAGLQEYAKSIDSPTVVLHTFSVWTHRPHLARGDNPGNYPKASLLSENHVPLLEEVSGYVLEDTYKRLREGRSRVAGNSSGFISGLADYAVSQDVPYEHGSSEFAVVPDGTVRIDPIFVSPLMLEHAKNPYGYRDRDPDYNPFDKYNVDESFPNLIQTTRGGRQWR